MKKNFITRFLLGFPLGISIGYFITILTSLIWGHGTYWSIVPEFAVYFSNEINGVLVQAILCGLIGAVSAASSIIWEMENWSIAKMTIIHFLVLSLTFLPVAYLTYWMQHSLLGIISYFGVFILIYLLMWVVQYFFWKKKIDQINKKLKKV